MNATLVVVDPAGNARSIQAVLVHKLESRGARVVSMGPTVVQAAATAERVVVISLRIGKSSNRKSVLIACQEGSVPEVAKTIAWRLTDRRYPTGIVESSVPPYVINGQGYPRVVITFAKRPGTFQALNDPSVIESMADGIYNGIHDLQNSRATTIAMDAFDRGEYEMPYRPTSSVGRVTVDEVAQPAPQGVRSQPQPMAKHLSVHATRPEVAVSPKSVTPYGEAEEPRVHSVIPKPETPSVTEPTPAAVPAPEEKTPAANGTTTVPETSSSAGPATPSSSGRVAVPSGPRAPAKEGKEKTVPTSKGGAVKKPALTERPGTTGQGPLTKAFKWIMLILGTVGVVLFLTEPRWSRRRIPGITGKVIVATLHFLILYWLIFWNWPFWAYLISLLLVAAWRVRVGAVKSWPRAAGLILWPWILWLNRDRFRF